jgi:hypothetical protein
VAGAQKHLHNMTGSGDGFVSQVPGGDPPAECGLFDDAGVVVGIRNWDDNVTALDCALISNRPLLGAQV